MQCVRVHFASADELMGAVVGVWEAGGQYWQQNDLVVPCSRYYCIKSIIKLKRGREKKVLIYQLFSNFLNSTVLGGGWEGGTLVLV